MKVAITIILMVGAMSVALANTTTETIVYERVEVKDAFAAIEEVKQETETEKIERLIRETFPERPQEAVAIGMGESLLDTDAYNPEPHTDRLGNVICYGSIGIMQIACVHVTDKMTLHDVETNLATARRIYEDAERRTGDGFTPWGAYTDGRYKKYLE